MDEWEDSLVAEVLSLALDKLFHVGNHPVTTLLTHSAQWAIYTTENRDDI